MPFMVHPVEHITKELTPKSAKRESVDGMEEKDEPAATAMGVEEVASAVDHKHECRSRRVLIGLSMWDRWP